RRSGIKPDTPISLYGANNTWFAAYALWLLKYYGHDDGRLLNGGRAKWLAEGRPMTTEVPTPEPSDYKVHKPDSKLRAMRDDVLKHVEKADAVLVDVRSPKEF